MKSKTARLWTGRRELQISVEIQVIRGFGVGPGRGRVESNQGFRAWSFFSSKEAFETSRKVRRSENGPIGWKASLEPM